MNTPSRISFESKCVCYISAIHRIGDEINGRKPCSGFFWRHDSIPYLITNRHCVTGKNALNLPIGKAPFLPTHLQIHYFRKGEPLGDGVTFYSSHAVEVNLWKDGEPDWMEHPRGKEIDLAAIRLDSPAPLSVDCINDRQQYDGWLIEAGADCFIVGFPEGIAGPEGTPIWKRGSIASEPELNVGELPLFLCDSATRPGLSGAPVFGKAIGHFGSEGTQIDIYQKGRQFFGFWPVFLGVYAGRNGNDKDGFQLGRVWKREALIELIEDGKKADSPFNPVA